MHPRLSDRQLKNIGAEKPNGKTAWVINPAKGDTMPALTWQCKPNGIQYLSARFSVPRQRWGHNARLPASLIDIYAGLGIAAVAIYNATRVVFNPLTANVTDVHYAKDIYVGIENMQRVLDRLQLRHFSRPKRIRFDHGVDFKQCQSSTHLYAKYFEVKTQINKGHIKHEYQADALQAANGILRVEHRLTLRALDRLQKKYGSTRLASAVLTPQASERVMTDVCRDFKVNEAIGGEESFHGLERLIEIYGAKTAMRLIGFLTFEKALGTDFWQITDLSRRTYYDNLRLCNDAGVWSIEQ